MIIKQLNKGTELKTSESKFILISGPSLVAKQYFVNEQCTKDHIECIIWETNADALRGLSVVLRTPLIGKSTVIILDLDKIKPQINSILLKALEESVEGYCVVGMTAKFSNVAETIISRADVYELEKLTELEKIKFCQEHNMKWNPILANEGLQYEHLKLIANESGVLEYTEKIYLNILDVPSANVFNIADKLKLTMAHEEDATRYTLELVLVLLMNWEIIHKKYNLIFMELLAETMYLVNASSVNKKMLVDNMILKFRGAMYVGKTDEGDPRK